jgi:hypothetical protein
MRRRCGSPTLSPNAATHWRLPLRVIRYGPLGMKNRSMSAMPRKRRLAVKMSAAAKGHFQTHAVQRTSAPGRTIVPSQPSLR